MNEVNIKVMATTTTMVMIIIIRRRVTLLWRVTFLIGYHKLARVWYVHWRIRYKFLVSEKTLRKKARHTLKKLAQVSGTSFWYKKLERVSPL